MSFLSLKFFISFLCFFYIYWNLPEGKPIFRRWALVLFSALFYYFFSFSFLLHYLAVISINFILYKFLFQKKFYLKIAVGFNLLNLFFFKYFYFFLQIIGNTLSISQLQSSEEVNLAISSLLGIPSFNIVLPATISYYTFQFISLAVDTKNGKYTQTIGFLDILSYALFFPVMIAGPILRIDQLTSQINSPTIDSNKMTQGFWLIARGLIKKSLIADNLLFIVSPIFQEPTQFSGLSLLLTTYFFGVLLYMDFSGLTDMARGIAKLIGFDLPENFKAPFFMTSFSDFWRRWHLTFSFWIRDYIYIPLGGSRVSEWRIYFNYIITFTLGGLWHGSNMNYALWGAINGFYLGVERFLEQKGWKIPTFWGKQIIVYLLVLHLSMITWILFFTSDVSSALTIIERIFTLKSGMLIPEWETGLYGIVFTFLFHLGEDYSHKFLWLEKWKKFILPILGILLFLMLIEKSGNIDFFYEKF